MREAARVGDHGPRNPDDNHHPMLSHCPVLHRRVLPALLAFLLVSCSPEEARSPADRAAARHGIADLVFFNGEILTLDSRMPRVRAMAVRQGRIIALGEEADIEPLTNASTQLEDLEGKTLIPGLMDARDPDAGAAPPPCREPVVDAVTQNVLDSDAAVFTEAGVERHTSEGVVAIRLPKLQVDALPALLARERLKPSRLYVRVGHWPACGAGQRLLLQQVMRELTQAPVGSRLRISLDPEPAVIESALPPDMDGAGVSGAAMPQIPVSLPPVDIAPLRATPVTLASPWEHMAAAMRSAPGAAATDALLPLRAFTVDAAREWGLDHEAGVLATGKRADVVVLDRNPLMEPPDRVAATVVLQTWIGGERVYDRLRPDDRDAGFNAPQAAPTQNP